MTEEHPLDESPAKAFVPTPTPSVAFSPSEPTVLCTPENGTRSTSDHRSYVGGRKLEEELPPPSPPGKIPAATPPSGKESSFTGDGGGDAVDAAALRTLVRNTVP